jgi:hypothetical protein
MDTSNINLPYLEDGDSMFLRNIINGLPEHTTSYSRKQ